MKYEFPTRFLCSVFLNADDIVPKSSLISELLRKLEAYELIPTTAREQRAIGVQDRIAFSHSQTGIFVILSGTRFDVTMQPVSEAAVEMKDFPAFIKKSSNILQILVEHFRRKGTRLACLKEGLYKVNVQENEASEIASKLFKFPPLYEKNNPFEWEWRCVSKIEREFGGIVEQTNNLLKILRARGNFVLTTKDNSMKKTFDGIQIDLDINTTQDDISPRFDIGAIESFFSSVIEWHALFENQVADYLKLPE